MNKTLIKDIVNHLIASEREALEIEFEHPSIKKIGDVIYKIHNEEKAIPLYLAFYKVKPKSCLSMVRFKDSTIGILITKECFTDFMGQDAFDIFLGIIAHELGHYLSGHLELSEEESIDIKNLNINTSKQDYFYKQNKELDYLRATVFGVLKGGCIKCELEADVIACKFVGIGSMLSAHAYTLATDNSIINLTPIVEKINRFSQLIKLSKEGKLNRDANYSLEINFIPEKAYREYHTSIVV